MGIDLYIEGDNVISAYIDETTGNWFIGNQNTGINAQSSEITPHIGKNFNWFISYYDTGIKAYKEPLRILYF